MCIFGGDAAMQSKAGGVFRGGVPGVCRGVPAKNTLWQTHDFVKFWGCAAATASPCYNIIRGRK